MLRAVVIPKTMTEESIVLGEFETTRKGEKIKFKVQTVPKSLKLEVIEHMTRYFLPRETICASIKLSDDPESVKSFQRAFELAIDQGAAMVALLDSSEPVVIGANMTYVHTKEFQYDLEMIKGDPFKLEISVAFQLADEANVMEKFSVDKYLSAAGLSVHSDYHGFQIGEKLLECRRPLCKHLGLDLTGTMFTNPISQLLAEKVGFETVVERDFAEIRVDGVSYWSCLAGVKIRYCVLKYN